jgi:molybdenum cofactor cytidylyltransferase
MKLVDTIRPQSYTRLAIVGAGGRTTTLFRLAKQIANPVIITTSDHLEVGQVGQTDHHNAIQVLDDLAPLRQSIKEGITLVTVSEGIRNRTDGLLVAIMEELNEIAHSHDIPLIIEADDSRRKLLKAPVENEPSIPDFVDTVIVLAGLKAIGKPFDQEWVHQPEKLENLSGLKVGSAITPQSIVNVLVDEDGGLKNIPKGARKIVFLNQVETPQQAGIARGMVKPLQRAYDVVFIGRMLDDGDEVKAAYVRVAGVVLAAGGSTRMGTLKQLLEWEGKPMVRIAVEKAFKAGLDPVVVITGTSHQEVQQSIKDLEVQIVHNPDWEKGQSTSVKAGINSLPDSVGAVIFFLIDQPKIPISFIEALIETHARTLAPIVVPMVNHKRGNPVLFDKITFEDLSDIEGDVGGRQVFSHFHLTWIPWVDSSVFVDVDTMEEYKTLFE